MTKKQVGEERIYSAYSSTLLFITKGSQDKDSTRWRTLKAEWIQKPWRNECCLLACSACFLVEPKTTSQGLAPPSGLGPPFLITNWETALQLDLISSRETLFSVITPGCVKLTHKTIQYNHLPLANCNITQRKNSRDSISLPFLLLAICKTPVIKDRWHY